MNLLRQQREYAELCTRLPSVKWFLDDAHNELPFLNAAMVVLVDLAQPLRDVEQTVEEREEKMAAVRRARDIAAERQGAGGDNEKAYMILSMLFTKLEAKEVPLYQPPQPKIGVPVDVQEMPGTGFAGPEMEENQWVAQPVQGWEALWGFEPQGELDWDEFMKGIESEGDGIFQPITLPLT